MGDRTGIEWTDATWNPMTGCTKATPGCDHCYAATIAASKTREIYLHQSYKDLKPCAVTWLRPAEIFFDDRMSEILSALGGAVLGSLVAVILYGRQAERQLRVETVRRFVANRFDLTGPDFSQAMNEIVVVFASKRKAIAALDAFRFDKTNANLIALYRELSAAAGIPSKADSDDLF